MGKKLPLARAEKKRQSMLLASTSVRQFIYTSSSRDQRTKEPATSKVSNGGKVKDTKTKSKGSIKTERANTSSFEKARRGRDNQNRESDRGDEGKHKPTRRGTSELGIAFPGSFCDKLETVPHHWIGVDRVDVGVVLRCKYCHDYIWLPMSWDGTEKLNSLMKQFGRDEGYFRYLNRHRPAKVLIAKLQHLRRLEAEITDKREFARLADEILSDREYDRKEVVNGD